MPIIHPTLGQSIDAIGAPKLASLLHQLIEEVDLPALGEQLVAEKPASLIEQNRSEIVELAGPLSLAGLLLLVGDLDGSHQISQSSESAEGSLWHGIMHRREGDFGNSKYWYRQIGCSALLEKIGKFMEDELQDPGGKTECAEFVSGCGFNGTQFVDACAQAKAGDQERLKNVAWYEWQGLMIHCLNPHNR